MSELTAIYGNFDLSFEFFESKKNTPMNFWDHKLFKIEVIKEKVIFKMSAEAHQFAIF